MKQKTIGINPLEDYLSRSQESDIVEGDSNQVEPQVYQQAHVKKQRVTFHISVDLIERLKNAVYWEPGLTLAALAESALTKALDDIELERGAPYAQRRDHKLKVGRPIL